MTNALAAAVRLPGWTLALAVDALAAVGGHAALRWGPTGAAGLAVTASAVLIATATASLSDDDGVDLTCTSPITLRRRTVARLTLGLLVAAAAGAVVLAGLVGTLPGRALVEPAATMTVIVALGAAIGVAGARIRPDVPAAIPAALLLLAGAFCARLFTLPSAVRTLDAWPRTTCAVLLAAAVVVVMTRDRAKPSWVHRGPARRSTSPWGAEATQGDCRTESVSGR